MTKKHFIALADAIRATKPEHTGEYDDGTTIGEMNARVNQWDKDVVMLADFCKQQNDRFDRERWLGYIAGRCGSNGGKVKQNGN